jgi:hypothetical protein
MIDTVMEEGDYKAQDRISEFLDNGMGRNIVTWLGNRFSPFLIFPTLVEDDNEFTSAQFSLLISNLMNFTRFARLAEEPIYTPAPPPLPLPPPPFQDLFPKNSLLWQYASMPAPPPPPPPPPVEELPLTADEVIEEDIPLIADEIVEEPPSTVKEAIRKRRLTIRKNGKYSRVKTRRSHLSKE